MRKVRWCKRIQ